MTLIISCATQEYAVQVSDRRLSWPDGTIADDHQNKGVLFGFRVAFAYTGLARLGKDKTDIWLTHTLSDPSCTSLSNALNVLKHKATARFKQLRLRKRHTFVGVGWTRQTTDPVLRPVICRTSNHFSDPDWQSSADFDFQNRVLVLRPNEPVRCITDGQKLAPDLSKRLKYMLRQQVRRDDPPNLIVLTLMKTIRECADSNSAVGKNLLSVVIPKKAVEHEGPLAMAVTGSPLTDAITFQCWPEGCWDGVIWGPNFASAGSAATNFQAGTLEHKGGPVLGGMTVTASGKKAIHYPCSAVRKRGAKVLLSHSSLNGKFVVIFTEIDLLDRIIEKDKNAEPVLLDNPDVLRHFWGQVRNDFDGVFFNPGGSDELSGPLNSYQFAEIFDKNQ